MTTILPPDQREKKPQRPKRTCPKCGSDKVARILYGLVAYDDVKNDLKAGRITLGGCCVTDESPAWECTQCGKKW